MRRTSFDNWPCAIARAMDLLGDWWTPLVLREAFFGSRRFEEFQRNLGIGRNVLTQRLNRLVDEGLMRREPYQERPVRYEYRLTPMGRDFFPVLAAILRWGETWMTGEAGPEVVLRHRACGHETHARVTCAVCGEALELGDVEVLAGPGLPPKLAKAAVASGRFGVRESEPGSGEPGNGEPGKGDRGTGDAGTGDAGTGDCGDGRHRTPPGAGGAAGGPLDLVGGAAGPGGG